MKKVSLQTQRHSPNKTEWTNLSAAAGATEVLTRHFMEVVRRICKTCPQWASQGGWSLEEKPTAFRIQLPFDLNFPLEWESMWFWNLFKTLNSYSVFYFNLLATAVINTQRAVRPNETLCVSSRKAMCGSSWDWCLVLLNKPFVWPMNLEITGTLYHPICVYGRSLWSPRYYAWNSGLSWLTSPFH